MSNKERLIIAVVLSLITLMVAFDLFTDSQEGVNLFHVIMEGGAGLISLAGVLYVMKDSFKLKHSLEEEINRSKLLKLEAEQWRQESKKYIQGLSEAIDQQLTKWQLTTAEKEVTFLLLKGLSIKEVADIRQTTDKTTRSQLTSIYSKAGLTGRSELAAYFLEDLLVPQNIETTKN